MVPQEARLTTMAIMSIGLTIEVKALLGVFINDLSLRRNEINSMQRLPYFTGYYNREYECTRCMYWAYRMVECWPQDMLIN
jgi:hypothetical protein